MAGMRWLWLVVVLAAVAGLGGGCSRKDAPGTSVAISGKVELLAQVGDQKITSADLEQAVGNLPDSYRAVASTLKGRRQILDNLIKKDLLVAEAEERGIPKQESVKAKIKQTLAQSLSRVKQQIADLQQRLKHLDRQVYENVLLTELNDHLRQDTQKLKEIPDADVQTYYEDYVRKLKLLNPAAVAPKPETVADKIRAILVEEEMLKALEKKYKVNVQEETFRRHYAGQEKEDITIQDSINP
jgi:hypothetical protein